MVTMKSLNELNRNCRNKGIVCEFGTILIERLSSWPVNTGSELATIGLDLTEQ